MNVLGTFEFWIGVWITVALISWGTCRVIHAWRQTDETGQFAERTREWAKKKAAEK